MGHISLLGPVRVNGTILTAGKDSGGFKIVPGLDLHSLMRLLRAVLPQKSIRPTPRRRVVSELRLTCGSPTRLSGYAASLKQQLDDSRKGHGSHSKDSA